METLDRRGIETTMLECRHKPSAVVCSGLCGVNEVGGTATRKAMNGGTVNRLPGACEVGTGASLDLFYVVPRPNRRGRGGGCGDGQVEKHTSWRRGAAIPTMSSRRLC